MKTFRGDVVELIVFDAQLPADSPKVAAVANPAKVKRIWSLRSPREPIRSFVPREPVKAQHIHDQPACTTELPPTMLVAVSVRMLIPLRIITIGLLDLAELGVSHMRSAFSTHVTIPSEIRDLQSGHLSCNLPDLRCQEK